MFKKNIEPLEGLIKLLTKENYTFIKKKLFETLFK